MKINQNRRHGEMIKLANEFLLRQISSSSHISRRRRIRSRGEVLKISSMLKWKRRLLSRRECVSVIFNWLRQPIVSRLSLEPFKLINNFNALNLKRCQTVKCDLAKINKHRQNVTTIFNSGNIQFH